MSEDIRVLVLHVPKRSPDCLIATLDSLRTATTRPMVVDLVIQGKTYEGKWPELPPFDKFPFRVEVHRYDENMGSGRGIKDAVGRFMATEAPYFAKLDDDITIPPKCWDNLLVCLTDAQLADPGAASVMASTGPDMPRRNLAVATFKGEKTKKLVFYEGSYHDGSCVGVDGEILKWDVCDFVGHGATIFERRVFDLTGGAEFLAPGYKVGGNNIDLIMMMREHRLISVLTAPPFCDHRHKECSDNQYDNMRYNIRDIRQSGQIFLKRWHIENELLTNFGDHEAIARIRARYKRWAEENVL